MCGIYGTIGCEHALDVSLAALRTLTHRGPDGEGHHRDEARDAFLGHRRLAIIDLSPAGSQPMSNEDGSIWLVLNGEIYNHEELREELQDRGHRFAGRCDAEVVLHLYEEAGEKLLQRLVGMFAFAIWDTRTGKLLVARDRLGIKPLYYYFDGRRFAFASELKAIRATPGLDLAPDVTAYWDFLTYQFVPAPKTIYRNAHKLPAGHYAVLSADRRLSVHKWWDVEFEPDETMTEERALGELDELLARAVHDHMLADVPVGLFFSAGVDSLTVATRMPRSATAPTPAFTIRFPDREEDEAGIAQAAAVELGLCSRVQDFDSERLLDVLPLMADAFDEPFGDKAALPMFGLSSMAAQHAKVVLAGDGGDETHLGYGRYFKASERRLAHALADALPGRGALARGPLGGLGTLRYALGGPWGRMCHFYGGIPAETKRAIADFTGPELCDYDDYWLFKQHDRPGLSPLARQQAIDFKTWLPDGLLAKVDRTSMRFGLEVRPPLLDHRLVELAGRIPDHLKCGGGVRKRLLKHLLERQLPHDLVHRRKRGFAIPTRNFVHDRGLLRPQRDLDVLGAFRIRKTAVEGVLSTSRDHNSYWLLHELDHFVSRG